MDYLNYRGNGLMVGYFVWGWKFYFNSIYYFILY